VRLSLLLVFLAALVGAPQTALAEPAVWVVRDKDSTIVLFGSVHILPKGEEWRPQVLTDAIARADDVWFEIPLDDAARLEAAQIVAARGLLPEGQSLLELLDQSDQHRLKRLADELNLPIQQLDALQPWLADITLTAAFLARSGANDDHGVESVLAASVPAGAEIRAFETPAQQISLLADLDRPVQIASLSDTMQEIEERPETFDRLVEYWRTGDVEKLRSEIVEPLREVSPALYQAMIQQRNAAWTKVIAERLAGTGDTVVVVGAGHLVGPEGVPAMLRALGLEVEGP